jgi:hypothetical protein
MSKALASHDLNLPPPPAPQLKTAAASALSPTEDAATTEAGLGIVLDDTLAIDTKARQRATQDLEALALVPATYAPLLLRLVIGPGQPPARRFALFLRSQIAACIAVTLTRVL